MPHPILEYRRPDLHRRQRVRTAGEEMGKVAALATLLMLYGWEAAPYKGAPLFLVSGAVLWFVIGLFAAWRLLTRHRRAPKSEIPRFWKLWTLAACLIALAWVPIATRDHHTCYHGKRWSNRVFGIAWSDNGGPCGNGRGGRGQWTCHLGNGWYVYQVNPAHVR